MKKYKLINYCPYVKHFVYEKPNGYTNGHLYSVTWYFSLCDWNGNEIDGFNNWIDEYDALDSGYYSEDTQTLVYPIVDDDELNENYMKAPWDHYPYQLYKLVQGMRTTATGEYYENF